MNTEAVTKHLEDIVARGVGRGHSLYVIVSKQFGEILSFDRDGTVSVDGETALTLVDNERSLRRKVKGVLKATVKKGYRSSYEAIPVKDALEWLKSLQQKLNRR